MLIQVNWGIIGATKEDKKPKNCTLEGHWG